ncbi:LysR family transcriptional regulator [Pedosphaera parvula]|uniref:Transcriptional regulator, LysR family n=1 Tax=Pedosphaera parvula (strain Ellin514) TaxID=320771 RepID=B9XBV2_PEDPL|nr:LysR family transcriptional regulator [Pedosphaera parvula]EEF62420.1 transcriptional regulator, LysR family [Pedosphaera parvula Ellin514]
MNIHHLELFYYVARFGGISEAVRNIPYGIQQPAVSGQIAQLEEFLGATLFHRRPFSLTPPGEKLYNFIKPFFSGLDALSTELQGGTTHQVRIGSSDVVLRDHLPELLQTLKKKFPQVKVALREGYQPELEAMLQKQDIDLAITLMEKKAPAGLQTQALLELPLILMVDKESPIASAEELWKRDRIQEPLICLPESEAICKNFQQGLSRLGVDWFPSIEVSSVDLIQTYVTSGFGIGLTVSIPKTKLSPKVRTIPLPNFAPVIMGALWRGKLSPPVQLILEELQRRARVLSSV